MKSNGYNHVRTLKGSVLDLAGNALVADRKVCTKQQFAAFIDCSYTNGVDSTDDSWDLSDVGDCAESELVECRGSVYDYNSDSDLYLGVAGVSKAGKYFGYYAYGNTDPNKCKCIMRKNKREGKQCDSSSQSAPHF